MDFRPTIAAETLAFIRDESPAAERNGRLTNALQDLIHRERWYRLFVPEQFGGLELSLPDAVRLEEQIAFADGSLGWVVTLCGGAALFIGYLDPQLASDIFSDPRACLAGSGEVGGVARPVPGGYIVNGSWPYASGAPDATYFTANCRIADSETINAFVIAREEVALSATWNYMGLQASAGHAFSVANTFIPDYRAFRIEAPAAVLPQPVYRYPFQPLAEITIAATIAGMCASFVTLAGAHLDRRAALAGRSGTVAAKGKLQLQTTLAQMNDARAGAYRALDNTWAEHLSVAGVTTPSLDILSEAAKRWARTARETVDTLYPYCGLQAAQMDTRINQVWRNIHTASQHTILL